MLTGGWSAKTGEVMGGDVIALSDEAVILDFEGTGEREPL